MKNWFVTGDCHCDLSRFYNANCDYNNSESSVIILGDAGINTGYSQDKYIKEEIKNNFKGTIYCVMGNHELRPTQVHGMKKIWDTEVSGYVYYQEEYPNIKYFEMAGIYHINQHRVLVLGGAYSVDKKYRLIHNMFWNPDEQMTDNEKLEISLQIKNQEFDFVLSHTCPISFQPIDLFISMDRDDVDNSMEKWLEQIKDEVKWKIWLFGHYHKDRLERPSVEMFFKDVTKIDVIWERWTSGVFPEWWLSKGPQYYY